MRICCADCPVLTGTGDWPISVLSTIGLAVLATGCCRLGQQDDSIGVFCLRLGIPPFLPALATDKPACAIADKSGPETLALKCSIQ